MREKRTRRPATNGIFYVSYFRYFRSEGFRKDENIFFRKKHSPSYFLIFPTFKVLLWLFAKKDLMIRAEMTFLRIDTIWEAFYGKIAICNLSGFRKKIKFGFRKNHLFFQKRPKFRTFWGILLFQAHSTTNLLQFDQKIISRSVAWTYVPMWRERNWQTSGKKTSEMAHLSGRFCFHILKNMALNNNNFFYLLNLLSLTIFQCYPTNETGKQTNFNMFMNRNLQENREPRLSLTFLPVSPTLMKTHLALLSP